MSFSAQHVAAEGAARVAMKPSGAYWSCTGGKAVPLLTYVLTYLRTYLLTYWSCTGGTAVPLLTTLLRYLLTY